MAYTYTTADAKIVALYEAYRAVVTPAVITVVIQAIGLDRIQASDDRSFNDIELAKWDKLSPKMQSLCDKSALKAQQGLDPAATYRWRLATGVCVAKTAAYMIRSEQAILGAN